MMSVVHEYTIRTPVAVSHVQISCNGGFVALPCGSHGGTDIGIWNIEDLSSKPLELIGHRKPVSSLCFSHKEHSLLLCSCAEDFVIIWNIEKCKAAKDVGQQIRGQIIAKTLGHIQHCAFNFDDLTVAVCVGREVHILETKVEQAQAILDGHDALVTSAEFCPHYNATLVTASEDRTFKIWNISEGSLIYQSTIISSSPFISLTMNPLDENFAIGSADGQVRVYDLTDGNGFRLLHQLDIHKMIQKNVKDTLQQKTEKKGPLKISSRPSWQRVDATMSTSIDSMSSEEDSEAGCSILGMVFTYKPGGGVRPFTPSKLSFLNQEASIVKELLEDASMLVIGTTGALLQINAKTLEVCTLVNLQEPIPTINILEDDDKTLSLAGSMTLSRGSDTRETICLLGSMFQNEVNIIKMRHPTQADVDSMRKEFTMKKPNSPVRTPDGATSNLNANNSEASGKLEAVSELTVLSSEPLCANSPLKAELTLKQKEPVKKGRGSFIKKSDKTPDQPITFTDKVKSSGYSVTHPRKTMFQPHISHSKPKGLADLKFGKKTPSKTSTVIKEYPMDSSPPTKQKVKLEVDVRPTAINCVRFSGNGQQLACALANTSAQVFKMPLTGKGCAFAGHNGSVTSVNWSYDNNYVISSSEDKSASVWNLGMSDPLLTFNTVNDNFGVDKEGSLKPNKENPGFGKAVCFAQFYYMDKFILLSSGNTFYLYKYHLDQSKSDIKRYLTNNRYKLVKSFNLDQGSQITGFSAVNGFYSYLCLCAGSNKSLEVFDLNVGQSVLVIPEAHGRPVHAICQNTGSMYTSHPPNAYDLFLTAAASDCIKLWDLRSNQCVRRYEGHANRIHPCGVAISPCSRFIATGSEDRSAYIFDIRSGTYLHKLTGHTDTVGDVVFHPLYPQLLSASLDGKLKLFTDHG